MKKLIVAEKPSVARDFARALGARRPDGEGRPGHYECTGYIITFCLGHMMRLKEPGEYRDDWKRWSTDLLVPDPFEKNVIESTGNQAEHIISLICRDDVEIVINAGDAGREGEGIQRELYEEAFRRLGQKKTLQRFWTSEALTREAIRSGLENLRDASEFDGLYRAFLARERADWLVGFNATRAFTSTFSRGGKPLSIGRVQTPVLALVVQREEEIEAFRSETFYSVHGRRGDPEGVDHLDARAVAPEDERGDRFAFWDQTAAEQVAADCRDQKFRVESVEEKTRREYPARLFSMPSLQEYCNRSFGWAPDRTLAIAQALYEKRFQTYPRTDSEHLGTSEQTDQFIKPRARAAAGVLKHGQAMLSTMLPIKDTGQRIFHDRKVTDHHAIVPSDQSDTACKYEQLDSDEQSMFQAVAERFLMVFQPPAILAEGEARLSCSGHEFLARARRTVDPGWTVYQEGKKTADGRLNLSEGEEFTLDVAVDSHETSSPKRFTQGEIIHAMTHAHKHVSPDTPKEFIEALREADGIGTGATRDSFIPLLVARGYVEVKRNVVIPLTRGRDLISLLKGKRIKDFAWTAVMERRLKDMVDSADETELDRFIAQALEDARELSEAARAMAGSHQVDGGIIRNNRDDVKTLGICPACGGDVVSGKKAWGCSNWRNGCKFTLWPETLSGMGHPRLSDREVVSLLKGRTDLKFKRPNGGSCYRPVELEKRDDGRWFARVDKEAEIQPEVVVNCPVCNGEVVEGRTIFRCRTENCAFRIFKDTLSKLGGADITRTSLKSLVAGDVMLRFRREDGRGIDRICRLEQRNERWSVKVDFEAEAKPEEMGACPVEGCEGRVIENPKAFGCSDWKSGCRFTIWKTSLEKLGGANIGRTQIKSLLKGPTWLKFKHPTGPVSERECRIELRGDRWGIQVNFDLPARPEVIGSCPLCGGQVTERPKSFSCAGPAEESQTLPGEEGNDHKPCSFIIWKDTLEKRGGPAVKKTQAKKLLAGEELGMTLKRDGRKIEAFCRLTPEEGLIVGRKSDQNQ